MSADYRYDENGHLLTFTDRSAVFPHVDPTLLAGWSHVHEDQARECAIRKAVGHE